MRPASVVIDVAAETGGNCELTEPGEVAVRHQVTIAGPLNLAHQENCLVARQVGLRRQGHGDISSANVVIDTNGQAVLVTSVSSGSPGT